MIILSRSISPKSSEIIESLVSSFHYPVEFVDIRNLITGYRPTGVFGAMVYSANSNSYTVYLSMDIPGVYFETNIIHELLHIKQKECDYPIVCNKVGSSDFATDPQFFLQLCSQVSSCILDLGVHSELDSLGLPSDFFIDSRLNKIASTDYRAFKFTDQYNCSFLISQIVLDYILASDTQKTKFDILWELPYISKTMILNITNMIQATGYGTPLSALSSMGVLLDSLNLWRVMYLSYKDVQLKTRKQLDLLINNHLSVKPST